MTPLLASRPAAQGRRAVAGVGVAIAAALGTAACGEEAPDSVTAEASDRGATGDEGGAEDRETAELAPVVRLTNGADRPRLACPRGERSIMIADFVKGAKGAPTPVDAVGLSSLEEGERLVVGPRGGTAWIVRADGTAREELDLIRSKGWLVQMRESCA